MCVCVCVRERWGLVLDVLGMKKGETETLEMDSSKVTLKVVQGTVSVLITKHLPNYVSA